MILIITGRRDSHVGAVVEHLDRAGVPWVRLNIEDFARNAQVLIDPLNASGRISLLDSGRTLDLEAVRAVWYRKPEHVDLRHLPLDPAALEYVEAEFTEVIQGAYGLMRDAFWFNDPLASRLSHRKLVQLNVAAQVGFDVPRTIVTNRYDDAIAFARKVDVDLAIKSLGAISVSETRGGVSVQYGVFTRRITIGELMSHGRSVEQAPTLFQEFIEKRHELRVTCVMDTTFACRIKPRSTDITADDYLWRRPA